MLGPLIAEARGHRPAGVRRLERIAPDLMPALEATLGDATAAGCLRAMEATAALYRRLRDDDAPHAAPGPPDGRGGRGDGVPGRYGRARHGAVTRGGFLGVKGPELRL